MEDIIYFNTYRDGKNLNDYRGLYNIFMLCNKGSVTFNHGYIHYTANGGDFVVWPSSKSCDGIDYSDQMDADVLLVSDYFLDLYRPQQVSDARGYEYRTPIRFKDTSENKSLELYYESFSMIFGHTFSS